MFSMFFQKIFCLHIFGAGWFGALFFGESNTHLVAGWKSYIFHFCKIICLLFLNFMAICGDIYDVIKTNSDMFNLYQIVVLLCTADLFFCQM